MPANPQRGEVDLEVDGVTYTLKLSTNAAAILEGRHKKPIGELMQLAAQLDFVAIRGIVWLLLQKHHAKDFKTEDAAGNFIDDAGGVGAFFETITRLAELNNGGADPNAPGQAVADGTGTSSTSAPDASA